ncbi:hypothetical protein QFZ43_005943 [Streptomyces afghaniensis]|nr:hypothetical protein [Streptomyces afghaniensis]
MSSEPYNPEGTTTGVRIVPPLPGVRDARAQIASGAGGRFALAGAKCERQLPARYGPAPEVPHARACPPSPACPATPGTPSRRDVPEACVFAPGCEHPRRPLRTRDHP